MYGTYVLHPCKLNVQCLVSNMLISLSIKICIFRCIIYDEIVLFFSYSAMSFFLKRKQTNKNYFFILKNRLIQIFTDIHRISLAFMTSW